jgi:CHAT domain-containing protein
LSGFYYTGSLPEDSPFYVGREKTLDDLIELATSRDPKYAIIFGAPLMGKTSLIKRLRHSLQSHMPLHIIYVGEHGENFYSYIASELIRAGQKQLAMQAADVHTGDDFQSLLRALAPSVTTVVVFEHLKRVPPATLKNFADILRNTSEMRSEVGNEAFRRFCFVLTGGIELYQAVGGSAVSPLNGVAREFYLGDFLRKESDDLLRYGFCQAGLPEEVIAVLCEKIYAQVHGHPYLTQYLGDEMAERWRTSSTIDDTTITESIDNLLNDDRHFTAMLDQARQEGLLATLSEVMRMSPRRPFMRGDTKVARLEAIGFIREESYEGKRVCIIRNLAYMRRLAGELGEAAPMPSSLVSIGPAAGRRNSSVLLRSSSMRGSSTCVLQLTYEADRSFRVRVVASRKGESIDERSTLPYTRLQLIAVFKALLPALRQEHQLSGEQIRYLQQSGLWVQENNRLIDDPVKKVGQDLYRALMVGEVGRVFDRVLEEAIGQSLPVALQLRFDPDDTELARYPWELLYHPTYDELLLSSRVEILRHMTYATDQRNTRRTASPLRMLYIAARPTNLSFLPSLEQDNVQEVLKTLHEEGRLVWTSLSPPTFSRLQDYLLKNSVHVLHFDGHGKFGRLCPKCQAFNYSIFDRCQRENNGELCWESLLDVDEVGYLSFENGGRQEHAIRSRDLSLLMAGRNIRLALLSACYSGTVDGHTLFGGTAQALIRQGVTSVIAPQLPMSPEGAAVFARGFYQALGETDSLLVALNRGRQSLLTNHYNEWFVPALYTRTGNHRLIDKLFSWRSIPEGGNVCKKSDCRNS